MDKVTVLKDALSEILDEEFQDKELEVCVRIKKHPTPLLKPPPTPLSSGGRSTAPRMPVLDWLMGGFIE